MRAILGIMFLCAASVCGPSGARSSPDTIGRGKTRAEAADCAGCHPADPARPFAGGKRIDTPFGGIYS
ncbi:MAG: cytochrome c, partial [Bradyrhizobium sp.]